MIEAPWSWRESRVLVTGVCGTVGRELVRQILRRAPAAVVGLDIDRRGLRRLHERHRSAGRARFVLADVRDRAQLVDACHGIDVVFHAAALKDIVQCERDPVEAVRTNVLGTQNVIDAARACGVTRVAFMSTDKAANPTSVLGSSKLVGEELVSAAHAERRGVAGPVFVSVRFGNVLGSSGSVVPVFARQIAAGGPVTLTDPAMTRFVMTLDEAVGFVIASALSGRGGEVLVKKMEVVRIEDLASVMVEELAAPSCGTFHRIPIRVIGARPGEKLHEDLISEDEVCRTVECEEQFVVLPSGASSGARAPYGGAIGQRLERPIRSDGPTPLGRAALRDLLRRHGFLGPGERLQIAVPCDLRHRAGFVPCDCRHGATLPISPSSPRPSPPPTCDGNPLSLHNCCESTRAPGGHTCCGVGYSPRYGPSWPRRSS